MKIGVTGGCGYVASVLVPQLLERGHNVDSLDIRPPSIRLLPLLENKKFRYLPIDVSKAEKFRDAAKEYDFIFHLAALVGYPACQKDATLAFRYNVGTTENVMHYKRSNTPVLFSSTISNYGPQKTMVDETTEAKPNSVYGQTKKTAEDLILKEKQNIVYRFAGAFGVSPQMRHDNLIHDFVSQAVFGRSISVYESNFIRQFIHVKDMAAGMLFALDHWGKMQGTLYNVGNPKIEITKRQLVEAIAKDFKFEYRFENSGQDLEKRDYPVSFKKITTAGFSCQYDLEFGIHELIQHYTAEQPAKELAYGR